MPNIQFNYLYRDSGNYKKYGFVIFTNPDNLELAEIEKLILTKLIDGEWFYANEWLLPELFSEFVDFGIDPTWHEFESIENTSEVANKDPSINEFIKELKDVGFNYRLL